MLRILKFPVYFETEIKCKYFNSLDGVVEKIGRCDELALHSIAIILGLNSEAEQL